MALNLPVRADAQANRVRLIEAARAVFAERGLNAEMKEIADRAGVGMGTIYRNFSNKEELIQAIIGQRIGHALGLIRATRAMAEPIARLRAILTIAYECAEEDGSLIVALGGQAAQEPPQAILAEIRGALEAGQAAGVFRAAIDPVAFGLFMASQLEAYLGLRRVFSPVEAACHLSDLVVHAVVQRSDRAT